MISRADLLKSPDYWYEQAQNELYRKATEFIENEGITRSELAERLGVTKGYVSQILNGNFNFTLKKLIEISLAMDLVPSIKYENANEHISREQTENHMRTGEISKDILIDKTPTLTVVYGSKLSAA